MTQSEVRKALAAAGIENADGEARILTEEFQNEAALSAALKRRTRHEPLQYIIGRWEFFRERYFVSPDCLIPRPDTEILVEYLVKRLPRGARFLDLCTGSGCIAVSTAKNRPDTVGAAADVSEKALALAKKNAEANGVSLTFYTLDVKSPSPLDTVYDCICANPPYIRTAVVDTLSPEVAHEPRIALDGGADGLDFYRAILSNFAKNLAAGGCFVFEFGYDQKADAERLAEKYGYSVFTIDDYGGNFRAAVLTK